MLAGKNKAKNFVFYMPQTSHEDKPNAENFRSNTPWIFYCKETGNWDQYVSLYFGMIKIL